MRTRGGSGSETAASQTLLSRGHRSFLPSPVPTPQVLRRRNCAGRSPGRSFRICVSILFKSHRSVYIVVFLLLECQCFCVPPRKQGNILKWDTFCIVPSPRPLFFVHSFYKCNFVLFVLLIHKSVCGKKIATMEELHFLQVDFFSLPLYVLETSGNRYISLNIQ